MANNINSLNILDTSDGTIEPMHVIKDKVGYSKGSRIVGTLDIDSNNLFLVAKYTANVTIGGYNNGAGDQSRVHLTLKAPGPRGGWIDTPVTKNLKITTSAERSTVNSYGDRMITMDGYTGWFFHSWGVLGYVSEYGYNSETSNVIGNTISYTYNIVDKFLYSGTEYKYPIYKNGYWYYNYKSYTASNVQ